MSQPCDREGTFQAEIIEYGLKEFDSGSVAVTVKVLLHKLWDVDSETWVDWLEYQMEAYGNLFVIKKDKTLNTSQVEALVSHAGWDGNFDSIQNSTWEPKPVQVVIKADTYKDETRYQVAFVNDFERKPGGLGTIDAAKAKELSVRYGGELRALAASAKMNATKPAAKPKPPSKPGTAKKDINKALQEAASAEDQDLPF